MTMIVRIAKPSRRYAETSHFEACCASIFGRPRPSFSNTAHRSFGFATIADAGGGDHCGASSVAKSFAGWRALTATGAGSGALTGTGGACTTGQAVTGAAASAAFPVEVYEGCAC